MKSILLTTTALVAFAGAAVADGHTAITFSGEATLGYNDDNKASSVARFGDHEGFYSDLNLDVALSATLDNGITVSAAADVDELDATDAESAGVTLTISAPNAALIYGDTQFAAKSMWSSAGDMEADSFSEVDGESVIKGTATFGDVSMAVSAVALDAAGNSGKDDSVMQLSFGAKAAVGSVTVGVAYQDELVASDVDGGALSTTNGDFYNAATMGIYASTAVAGATVKVAYASEETTGTATDYDSTGISVSYPMGDLTLAAYFVSEGNSTTTDPKDNSGVSVAYKANGLAVTAAYADEQGTEVTKLEGSFDVGSGLTLLAGYVGKDSKTDDTYVAATYSLGGGASLLVSYADDTNSDEAAGDDDIGAPGYQVGTTVAVSFKF